MRFHSRHPSASHLGKRAQTRLLRMVSLLLLVMIAIKVAGRASFWSWMFPDQVKQSVDRPEPPATVDPSKFKVDLDEGRLLQPGVFIAPDDSDKPTSKVSDSDTLEFPPDLLRPIRDNTLNIRRDELAAYHTMLAKARDVTTETLQQAADRDVSFPVLMNQSSQFRGKPISIRGEIRRLLPFSAGENKWGLDDLWEAWFFTDDSQNSPYRIVCTEIPPGIPRGESLKNAVPARVTGFFFKIEGYQSQGGLHTAPLLLAKTIKWLPPPPTNDDANSAAGLWIVGVVCLTAFALAITFWRISASDRASQTKNFHRYYEPRAEALEALKSLETTDEADLFKHLEEDGQAADV